MCAFKGAENWLKYIVKVENEKKANSVEEEEYVENKCSKHGKRNLMQAVLYNNPFSMYY